MAISVARDLAAVYVSTHRVLKAREILDQAMFVRPVSAALKLNGRVRYQKGGDRIVQQISKAKNPTFQWINRETGDVDVTKHDPFTENQYEWMAAAGTVWALHVHAATNPGPFQIFNLQQAFKDNAVETQADVIEQAVVSAAGPDEPYGLPDIIADDPTTGTIGVINRATAGNEYFRNGYLDCAARPFSTHGKRDMTDAFLTVSKKEPPKDLVIFCDMDTWRRYHEEVGEKQQIISKKYADLGFPVLDFMGSPVLWSPDIADGHMYFVPMGRVHLYINSNVNAALGEWIAKQGSLNLAAHMVTECQLTIETPRAAFVNFGITD